MKKPRWREVKKKDTSLKQPLRQEVTPLYSEVSYFERFKAQVIDSFMIYTPILYITTYFALGSAAEFRENQIAVFVSVTLYGFILSLFIAVSGQTPGYKALGVKLVSSDKKKRISFVRSFLRFFVYLLSMVVFSAVFLPFFYRNRTTLHDAICRTKLIKN
ncbi:hypothetical protein CCZ01_05695 [Helicobacter monodelphidis]|uniref:RDD family protein n=1 Tax=Helicobacter sp. 15-1451 TaxID=2004995 RepID=UPI000DCAE492|nr:RDD family protein [Helicobacter sp. 15-1451]RAX57632.1 hypothetical protein CCZ01_05695 [Helicobacter sp. 15-1451]